MITPSSPRDSIAAKGITFVIPAHEPGPELVETTRELTRRTRGEIIIVDDGTAIGSREIFEQVGSLQNVTVLRHEKNRGKGAALKTAFRHIIDIHDISVRYIITLDADGQHSVDDVLAVAQQCESGEGGMIIGVRSFSDDVPLRSRFGNLLTRAVLRWTAGMDLDDTQSGLRCLPIDFVRSTLGISSDRYEFELECILLAKKDNLPIVQIPIQTIYLDDNESSHFRPVVDSLRIYMVFGRFVMVSLASFVLDISFFSVFYYFSGHIIGSTYVARGLSGSFNFYFNKHTTFRSHGSNRYPREVMGYVVLAVLIATISGAAVVWLSSFTGLFAPMAKILVDSVLFFVSFLAQRYLVFQHQTDTVIK